MKKKFLLMMMLSLLFTAMGGGYLYSQELLVNCDYNSSVEGYGTTKFSNYAGAYAYATANAKKATIVIEKTNTISGNCFEDNHKNYSNLKVVIKDGATMGNALSKWDMTYPVTVEPGGTLTCARPKTASVSYIHIKSTLTVGAEGAEKKAYVDFLSDTYQDCDISIRNNGKINVYNSVFRVQDLDAQGTLTIKDSEVYVDGAFASATFLATTLTNTEMVVNGNQISGGLSDFAGGDANQLGNVKINNSTLKINEGTTKVAANVTATNSTIAVNDLTINNGKTLNLNDGSTLEAEKITAEGTGSVKIDGVKLPVVNGVIVLPEGNDFTGYTSADDNAIWGEVWGNATTSFVIKVLDANGNVMGTTSLNNVDGIIDGDVNVTWNLKLDAASNTDEYWTMEWTTAPTINNMPAKVELWVDGVKVSGGPVQFNGPDDINKIYAATADAEGKLIRFYNSIETIVNNEENVNVVLVRDVTGSFETFHNVTLYSGVKGGASITNTYSADYTNFNKVIVKNGVTLNMNNVFSTTAESVNTIEGTMNVVGVYYHSSDAKTEIKNGGKVTTGGMTIVRYNNNPESGIYIYGDGDDTTVEFSCQGDAIGAYSGTFYAKDAVVETKGLRLDYKKDKSEESDVYAQINAKFVDTKLSVSSELRLYKDAALTLNGATVTAGKVQIRENATPTINIDNSTIKANSVENLPGATWNAVMDENGYVTFVRTGLAGGGTEANPYLINNLEDLVFFRDQVNTYTSDKSNQFRGKFVKLTNDIDLQGINWTPIGTNSIGDHAAFLGTFYGEKADGTIPTISNLYINANGDHLGFFARVGNHGDESCTPTIKNIKFNNVDVSSNTTTGHGGSYVAGVIANAGGNSVISNIEVTGDVYVVGYGYIGGIVGHGYPDIDNCHVIANEGSYIQSHYWCCGGIIGYAGEGGTPITNSSVSGVDIWASLGGAAAVAGLLQDGNRIENVSASNVNITSNSDYCMGYIAGNGEESTLTEISIENVTATANGNPITVTDAVAQIGNSIYFNLQDVLNAGGNVTVLRDIALAEGLTVAADKTVVLDLNGKTITGTPAEAKAFAVITNKGDLTITDGTETEGKIVCDHKLAGSTGYAVNTITNSGTLTIAAGTIQNTSTASNQIGYAIDNNSTTGNTILVIEGGKVTASGSNYYDGIRQFCSSETLENNVTIEGGEVSSLWLQNPSDGSGTQNTKDVKGSFAINGGTLNNLYLEPSTQFAGAIIGGHVGNISRFQTAEGRDLEGFISGGTFSSDVSEFCAEGFKVEQNPDGTYGVVPFETKEYVINANGEIKTLADAIAKAKEDGTDEVTYTIYGAATLETGYSHGIVDFGGREGYITIQGGSDNTRSTDSFKITGGGVPDIKGVTFKDLTFYDEGTYLPTANEFMYQNFIDCTFENVTFEDGIRLSGNSVVRNCTFNANTNDEYAIWLDEGTFEMTGSTVTAGNEAYGLLKSDVVEKITISGNTFQYLAKVNKEALNVKDATIVATGNTFIDCAKGVVPTDKTNYTENGTTITNEIIAQNNTVVVYVAKIGDTKYQSLAAAATAAQDGETIQLLWAEGHAPISMAATIVNNKTVTITGTADVDWDKGWLYVGRNGEGNGKLIFKEANLTSKSVGVNNNGLGLNVSCKKEGESTTNNGEVEIIDSHIQLDYLIGKGNIKLDNSTLEVYEGFAVGARPASETGGVQRTVTMDITNGSNVIVDNHNGQGLGHESNGIMNIDATSTFETKRSFLITANGTMNNAGTVTINGTLTNNGTIKLTDVALTGMTIDGTGTTYFYNTVNFYGNNNITTDINGSPFELIVNEDATLLISRFVLGYDRAITVYGNIEDAHNLTAEQIASMTPSLKFNSTSGVSVGGNATGRLTANDAYLEFGSSSWKNSHAEHTWRFENCYVSATSFGNNNEPGAVTSTWNVTFDNSVLAAKNYIKNGVGVSYNFTNGSVATTGSMRIDGELNVDATSSVTTTAQQNNKVGEPDEHGGVNGTINIDGTLTIGSTSATQLEVLDGEVNVTETGNIILLGNNTNNTLTLDAYSKMRSCGNITGAITAAEGADVEITGGTYTQDVNEWCHEYYDAIPNGNGTWTVEQVMYALVRDLQEGWSWFSSFINIDGEAGLTKIKDALGENGVQVKDAYSGSFIQYTSASGWKGLLNEASSKAVYSIKTINDGDDIPEISVKDFTIKGAKVDPSLLENTVYINKGWNYIAYPLDQVAGLDVLSFTPAEGDVIKSKESSSMYWGGGWISNIDMTPGEGYMYKSNDNATKSFNFAYPTRSAVDASISNNVTNDYYWSVNAHKYPSNMTIVAMLNIDNELVKDSYEIAAFANGECRGRAQSVYVESLDTYVLVLTVHGEDVENITFKYYDVNSGAEYELSNIMVYSNDAIVGSVDEPYMFNLDILNVEEASINDVNVYPNPTTTNAEIDLNATCDKVEVFNALGVKVAEYSNVDSIDALETAGVYVIRVTIDGNVRNCRLIVK